MAQLSRRRKLVFVASTVVLVAVVVELVLQVFYFVSVGELLFRRALPPIYVEDPIRCYGVEPNLDYVHRTNEFEINVHTDSRGFRTDAAHSEIPVEKPDDVYRVLFTGPSFTFGWGADYEDIYPTLIGRSLHVPGKRVEILNIGTPAQGPAHQLCWIQARGVDFDPDMVVHTAYGRIVPSLPDSCPENLECPIVTKGLLMPRDLPRSFYVRAFFKNFATVFYGYYAYSMLFDGEPQPDSSKVLHDEVSREETTDAEEIAQTYVAHERRIKELLGEDTVVAYIFLPYSYAVHEEDVGRFPDVRAEDIGPTRGLIARIRSAIEASGIHLIDTLPGLIEAARSQRLYYWLDIHLTDAGNETVARIATPALQALIDQSVVREDEPDRPTTGDVAETAGAR